MSSDTRSSFGSIKRVGKGRYRVQLSVGRDPATGKRRRFDRTIRGTRADAELLRAKLALEAGALPTSTMTLQFFIEEVWIPRSKKRLAERTWVEYLAKMKRYVIPVYGHLKLGDVKAYQLQDLMDDLAGKGLSEQTRLHVYRILSNAFNQAVIGQLIPLNPMAAIKPPHVELEFPDVLEPGEVNDYLDAFEGSPIETYVIIAIGAGLRRSEITALDWSDIRFWTTKDPRIRTVSYHAEVDVHRTYHQAKGHAWFGETKTPRSTRVVVLPEWAAIRLRTLRGVGPLVALHGDRLKPSTARYFYLKTVKDAGLRPIMFKNLRHTHATMLLDADVDLLTVSRRLGHSTTTMVSTRYAGKRRRADESAAAKMDGLRHAK